MRGNRQQAKYRLPDFLNGTCDADNYRKWLTNKARSLLARDRKRGNTTITVSEYKQAIHHAVGRSGGSDAYTGLPLRWDLLRQYNNQDSKKGGRKYRKKFANLPSVDHVGDGQGKPRFKICSLRVNDCKSDLTLREFQQVCRAVLDDAEDEWLARMTEEAITEGGEGMEANAFFDALRKERLNASRNHTTKRATSVAKTASRRR